MTTKPTAKDEKPAAKHAEPVEEAAPVVSRMYRVKLGNNWPHEYVATSPAEALALYRESTGFKDEPDDAFEVSPV